MRDSLETGLKTVLLKLYLSKTIIC